MPRTDYIAGLVSTIDEWLEDLDETNLGIRNVVLALARICCGIVTDECGKGSLACQKSLADRSLPDRPKAAA